LLLASSLSLLAGLLGSQERGAALWTTVAVLGAALGPVLGGVLTQVFDWRAIFAVQAPVAAAALLATVAPGALPAEDAHRRKRGALAADAALALVFAVLVGALFLAVLLVITVWGLDPIVGALVVSALPAATIVARPLARRLAAPAAVGGGALLLAAGLVLGLALVAPLLTGALDRAGERALLGGTKEILDANVPLRKKVPIALALRDALETALKGEVPDLTKPFDDARARTNTHVREARDSLVNTLESVLTRGFRSSFGLAALFAACSLLPAWRLRAAR
jgi:MFS family permease